MNYMGLCKDVPILLGSTTFLVDLYVVSFFSTDVELGVVWFKSLGEVTFNYDQWMLSYPTLTRSHTIANVDPPPQQINPSNGFHALSTTSECEFFFLWFDQDLEDDPSMSPTPVTNTDPAIRCLLDDFVDEFQKLS